MNLPARGAAAAGGANLDEPVRRRDPRFFDVARANVRGLDVIDQLERLVELEVDAIACRVID